MNIYVDATTLISLGTVGELELLTNFDGDTVVLPAVLDEVTTEPARTNLNHFVESNEVSQVTDVAGVNEAKRVLGAEEENGDVQIVAAVLSNDEVAVVSDDRRVRTVAEGFGATVTGTVGVIVRAVDEGMPPEEANEIVERVDEHGLHMTAELREKAYELIETAAE